MIPRVHVILCILRDRKPIRIGKTSEPGSRAGLQIHVARGGLDPGVVQRRRGGELGVRARVSGGVGDRIGGGVAGTADGEGRGGGGEVGEGRVLLRGRGGPAIAGVRHRVVDGGRCGWGCCSVRKEVECVSRRRK